MKLHLLNRTSLENSSYTVTNNEHSHFLRVWHYHPELELVVVLKSTGTRFIGDSIEKFEKGELILIGKNLPHMWLNDPEYFDATSHLQARAVAVHFSNDFLGKHFFKVPEMQPISELFQRALYGIKFLEIPPGVIKNLVGLLNMKPFDRTIELLKVLNFLANHKQYEMLSSTGFVNSFNPSENKGLDKIYSYVFKNFKNPISSKDVAVVAHMNPSAFSRFFRRIHRKTFTRYLNEIRIGYACKLLIEKKYNITVICYESGFSNISNFNRQFKEITGMSPTVYVHHHTKK